MDIDGWLSPRERGLQFSQRVEAIPIKAAQTEVRTQRDSSQCRGKHLEAAKDVGGQTVANPRSIHIPADKTGILEHCEVLGNRRLGEADLIDDVTAHTA
jgi:hypothetical protein